MTIAVTGALFLIFFLISWTIPIQSLQHPDTGVEVNLGNSDFGSGNVAPQSPGEPSAAPQTTTAPPPAARATAETEKEVIPNNDPNATPVNTSPKPEKKTPKHTTNIVSKPAKPKAVEAPAPKPQRPKAVYAGGKSTSSGGNNADSYNNVHNQGIAGGKGDQGKPNGNPNSDSYTGNGGTGSSGITANVFGRTISGSYRFEDSYQHGGTVLVDVTVDANGKVTSATARPGCPFPELNKIAERRAKQIIFTSGTDVQTGTIKIKFEAPKG